jgi:hypothetical protein
MEKKVESKNKNAEKKAPQVETSFLDDVAGEGFEGIKSSIPRIVMLQPLSRAVQEGDEHVEGAKPGVFMNTVTKKIYGKTLSFIPVKALSVWQEWAPMDSGGGFRGRHQVGSIPITGDLFKKAYTNEGNEIREAMEIYGIIPEEMDQGLVLLSLSGASIKHGVNWGTKIGTIRLPSGKIQPFYGSVWELELTMNKNAKGSYYTIGAQNKTNVEWERFITRDEYNDVVHPAVEFCGNLVKMLLSADATPGQKAIAAPDSEY